MSLPELKKYIFRSKYAGFNKEKKRRETWNEAVERSENMMLAKYANFDINEIIKNAYTAVKKKQVLGSQRALQFGGNAILNKNARMYNCALSILDRPRFFQEATYLLLCGCGTGFSVQKHHVAKLPNLVKSLSDTASFTIPDTIEGWADAIGILVNSYFRGGIYKEYEGKRVHFSYTKIRPAGSKLSYTTGKAPGPEPLKNSIEKIRKILDNALEAKQTKLRPIQAYDIIMHASDCVLAGGIRRSATICLFSPDDKEMMNAKTGNWFNENPQRGRSNNSVVLLSNKINRVDFDKIFDSTRQFGEPGIVFVKSLEHVLNPCAEVSCCPYWIKDENLWNKFVKENGDDAPIICQPEEVGLQSGWQFCNLSTINGGKVKTKEDFYEACEAAATIGTFQAGFTDFPYLGEVSEKITRREALLGVSITGIMDNPEVLLNPEVQRHGAKIIQNVNEEIAKKINILPAARLTVIKPEGTSSCVLGTSSGIHPHHATKYFRRVQATRLEPLYQYFKTINSEACEESVWSNNDSDDIITFCIDVPDKAATKTHVSAIRLLEAVKLTKQNWIKNGTTNRGIRSWLEHNVSNTVSVKQNEWGKVADFIFENREYFCGISLLPDDGDKDYQQAPFVKIYTEQEIIDTYGQCSIFASGLIEKGLELFEDNLWKACDILLGLGGKIKGDAKISWVEKCNKFATNYLNGDIKKLTYLMKDVHNWKLWLDLKRTYKDVDYDSFIEDEENVNLNHTADAACSGGQCSIIKT